MNYFRCTVRGSSGGNSLTVTCSPDFAGINITATKGSTSFTKTCPTSEPFVVEYNSLENGTYTISAIKDEEVFSTEVVIKNIDTDLDYGFSWKTWINLSSKLSSDDYDGLTEILEDEFAVRELFLEHACVDYMASSDFVNLWLEEIFNNDICAKWINNCDYALDSLYANEALAELMDDADKYFYGEWVIIDDTTTPVTWGAKGNVPVMTSNTAPYGTASAYQVFDGQTSTTASGTDFSYKFTSLIMPKSFYCDVSGGTLQASNNGSTWDVPESGAYYLYLRLHFESSVSPHTIQFYGRELKVTVPTMTSKTAPYGTASANTAYNGNYDADKAFTDSGGWSTPYGTKNCWCQYLFTYPVRIIAMSYKMGSGQYALNTSLTLLASNDNSTFTEIVTKTGLSPGTLHTFEVENEYEYKYYRVRINGVNSSYSDDSCGAERIQFYGMDYSEKEFTSGTTMKWIYDHGLEFEDITVTGSGDKRSYYIRLTAANSQATISLDTTSYKLMRTRTGLYASGTNQIICGTGTSNFVATNMPNTNGLNITSINNTQTLGIKQTAVGVFDFEELWLE